MDEMLKMEQVMDELKHIDELLSEELREVTEFEAELFGIQYELDEEVNLVARLHNACHTTAQTIKHLHALIRRIEKSPNDRTIPIFKNMIKRHIHNIETEIDEIISKLDLLEKDEQAGKKIVGYCKKIEQILRKKVAALKQRFKDITEQ